MPIDCISFRDTAYASKLICDYVEKHPELQPFYSHYPTLENFKPQVDAKKAWKTKTVMENRRVLARSPT